MRILLIACFTFIVITLCSTSIKAQGPYVSQSNPQNLISFAVTQNSGNILISWKVSKESDRIMFGVEKSIDTGKTFQSIGTVQSNGFGIYSFADNNPATGQDQYRLKIQDDQGNDSYSNALIMPFRPMNVASTNTQSKPYANPINQKVTGNDDSLDMSPVSTQ